jgi:ABC-type phosphate transport system substrate-binding protein
MRRYHSFTRIAALVACVGSTSAIAALAGASPAVAAECQKGPLYASGSSFQKTAQEDFKAHIEANSKCTEKTKSTTITYTPTSSGKGMEVFGAGNLKNEFATELLNRKDTTVATAEKTVCEPTINKLAATHEPSGKCLDIFIGTDDAPTALQLENMTNGAVGKTGSTGSKTFRGAVVIPIAQGPVTAMLSLPAGCKIEGGSKVDMANVALGQLYEGERVPSGADPGGIQAQGGYLGETWGALLTQLGYTKVAKESELTKTSFTENTPEETLTRFEAGAGEETVTVHSKSEIEKNENPGGRSVKVAHQKKEVVKGEGCTGKIKAQVRASESGTSFAFKSYLNQINPTVWSTLATDGVTWPALSNVIQENIETSGKTPAVKQEKGSQLAEATGAIPGSVGYADSADAALKGGFGETAVLTNRPWQASSTLEEVVKEGEAENLTTKAKEPILTLKAQPVKSIYHQIVWAQLQDNGTGKPSKPTEFESPLVPGKTTANCQGTSLIGGDEGFPKEWPKTWNGVLASDPNISKVVPVAYPLCAFTYDVAWHHYANVELYGHTVTGEHMAATAKDYFEYVTGQGVTDLTNSGFYTGPPTAMKGFIKAAVKAICATTYPC